MFYNNFRGQRNSFVQEKHVLESEASCEDHVGKQSQSGRKMEINLSLRKCCSLDGPLKNIKSRRTRRRRRQNFKVVLQVQFVKGTANKQPRKKTQKKKSSIIKKSDCKAAVPSPIDCDSNTL